MRFQKSVRNLLVSWLGQAAYIIINMFVRKIFIDILGADMLGISGLFSNILSFLSFAELGIASAVCYSLYRPLAENDEKSIREIMYFFKIAYRMIGIFILTAGTLMLPVLYRIVPEVSQYKDASLYYEIFVINTALSYFYVYKATLIEANQDRYMKILNHYLWVCMLGIMQIAFLFFFRNYIVYLMLQTIFTLFENICVSKIADRHFPYLKENKKGFPRKETLREITRNVAGNFLNRFGTTLVTATDNILISRFVGLAVTGIFSNYAYIVTGVSQIFRQVYDAAQAGIGDLNAQSGIGRVREIYKEVLFDGYMIFSFGFVIMANCIFDFVGLWIGKDAMLPMGAIFLHLCNFFVAGMRTCNMVFINAMGLQWEAKYKGILEGLLNFVISIIWGAKLGLTGIILGTTISTIIVGVIIEPYILCKHGLRTEIGFVLVPLLKYIVCAFGTVILTGIINWRIMTESGGTIGRLIIKFVISCALCMIIFYVLWRTKAEYRSLQCRVIKLMHKLRGR